MKPSRAKLAFLTEPSAGVFVLNFQFGDGEVMQLEISKAQLGNILVDGAGMALQSCKREQTTIDSVRLGPEAIEPAKPYTEPA